MKPTLLTNDTMKLEKGARKRFLRSLSSLPLCLFPLSSLHAEIEGLNDTFTLDTFDQVPSVLTPARLKQPRTETPASVTVITREMIRNYGARYLQDVLRLVPGVTVGVTGSNVPTLSYHGTNASDQRRLQVLIDGRSQYAPNLAAVDWLNMPLALEDIERIEVTRGPNAATYGANSFLAIINIITRDSFDTVGGQLVYSGGSNGFQRYYARLGGVNDDFSWRLSGHGRKDNGYDHQADGEDWRDSYDLDGFNLALSTPAHLPNRLTLQAGLINGEQERRIHPEDGMLTAPDAIQRDRYASMRWDHDVNENHFFHAQVYFQRRERRSEWINCVPSIFFYPSLKGVHETDSRFTASLFGAMTSSNPFEAVTQLADWIASGGYPMSSPEAANQALAVIDEVVNEGAAQSSCGTINSDLSEKRLDFEFQDTLRLSPQLTMVSGFSLRQDDYESETYFDNHGQNRLARVFGNLQFKPRNNWVFNGGAMWEYDDNNGSYISPRVAANYLISPNQSLRFVLSHAVRSPDTYEQMVQWRYVARDLQPAVNGSTEATTFTTTSTGNLDNEKIVSREIGYYLNVPDYRLELDVKLFRDNMWDLISAPLQFFSFEPENNLSLTQTGAELEFNWRPSFSDQVRLSYGYLDQDQKYTGTADFSIFQTYSEKRLYEIESRLNARHSGSLSWLRQWSVPFSTTVVYFAANDLNDRNWQRADFVLSYEQPLWNTLFIASLKYEYLFDNEPLLFDDYEFDDAHHLYGTVELQF